MSLLLRCLVGCEACLIFFYLTFTDMIYSYIHTTANVQTRSACTPGARHRIDGLSNISSTARRGL